MKLQASFNPFESLPDSLWRLPRLEMFRLAVGRLQQWPDGLAESGALPKLAWCSLGSNPAALPAQPLPESLPRVTLEQLQVGEKLGAGASGEVFTGALLVLAVAQGGGGCAKTAAAKQLLKAACESHCLSVPCARRHV